MIFSSFYTFYDNLLACYNTFMTDSLGDLLQQKRFNEPSEIEIIKEFVRARFQSTPQVTIQDKQIIIGVNNAALAGALRMHLHELTELCATSKRLVIRIGQ